MTALPVETDLLSPRSTDRPDPPTRKNLMPDLYVSWDQYNASVERLALNVYESGYAFNQIICIARGRPRAAPSAASS